MKGRLRLGRWASGPDIRDCLTFLHIMDNQGGLFTTVMILPDGSLRAPHCMISILSVHKQARIGHGKGAATMYDGFPCREHTTFEGSLYAALLEHDRTLNDGSWGSELLM